MVNPDLVILKVIFKYRWTSLVRIVEVGFILTSRQWLR